MERMARHNGDGISGNPGVFYKSEDKQAQIDAMLISGNFEDVSSPSAVEVASTQSPPFSISTNENTVHSPRSGDGSGIGSFGSPASRSAGVGASVHQTGTGQTGVFGAPAGTGASGKRGRSTQTIRANRSFPIRDLFARLPELWGLDLVLTLVTIAGIYMIVTNLSSILLAIAEAIYVLLNGAMEVGIFVAIGTAAIWFAFGRRRRL